MLAWLRRHRATPSPIPDTDWRSACADIELTAGLDADQRLRLRADCARFLHEKRFAAAGELDLDDGDCLRIAVLACLPVLGLGYDWLRGWSEVIVYPGQFRVRRNWHDEASGVVSESEDWLAGESWQHGPLILSLEDIHADLEDPHAGFNLVAHEVAHKLDMLDGHSDGVPPLPDRAAHRTWVEAFEREFKAFRRLVDAGRDTVLDPYAAEAPDEFFAVASETYFSAPGLLREAHPDIHRELRTFYGVELVGPAR
jgi:Mlc titration factor MtfA (ptsG expression regulator)